MGILDTIPDGSFNASSELSANLSASSSRLTSPWAWSPVTDIDQSLEVIFQINMNEYRLISLYSDVVTFFTGGSGSCVLHLWHPDERRRNKQQVDHQLHNLLQSRRHHVLVPLRLSLARLRKLRRSRLPRKQRHVESGHPAGDEHRVLPLRETAPAPFPVRRRHQMGDLGRSVY